MITTGLAVRYIVAFSMQIGNMFALSTVYKNSCCRNCKVSFISLV